MTTQLQTEMKPNGFISREDSMLVIVDVQEKLLPAVESPERLVKNVQCMLKAADLLEIPVVITEHCAEGIGHTVDQLLALTSNPVIIEKTHFCATREPNCIERFQTLNKSQAVVVGTEAHVCVLQTALGLQANGFQIAIPADAVSSRCAEDKALALERIKESGGMLATTEMVVFEWLKKGDTSAFKTLLPMIKSLKQ